MLRLAGNRDREDVLRQLSFQVELKHSPTNRRNDEKVTDVAEKYRLKDRPETGHGTQEKVALTIRLLLQRRRECVQRQRPQQVPAHPALDVSQAIRCDRDP